MITFKYFSIIPIVTILAVVVSIYKKASSRKVLLPIVLFIGSVVMYSSHYRGYYFLNGLEPVTAFCTFRYLNNIAYLMPLCFCFVGVRLNLKLVSALLIFIGISVFQTYSLREEYGREENTRCFSHCNDVTKYLLKRHPDNKFVLVTDKTLRYQVLCNKTFNICDICSLKGYDPNKSGVAWYLDDMDFEVLTRRYGINLDSTKIRPVADFKELSIYSIKGLYEFTKSQEG